MASSSQETNDVWKTLLILVIITNTVILEKSVTANRGLIWWLVLSIPILIILFRRSRQHVNN
jgi:hypothetical protein